MEKRQDGFWRIPTTPLEVRNQPHWFKIKFGEVFREYSKVSFDKEKAFKGQAEFVSMGHPLMESLIEAIFQRFSREVEKGATFLDPECKRKGLLWFLDVDIRDGMGTIAGRRLFSVYQEEGGGMQLINPSILWDLKPLNATTIPHLQYPIPNPLGYDDVTAFIITRGLETYKKELLERRKKDAGIKQKYGVRSLESLILKSEEKLTDYETRRIKGENIPEVTIKQEERKKEDLIRKKEKLLDQIRAETHLLPSEPKILGVARIIPMTEDEATLSKEMKSDKEIEKIGMGIALGHERKNGREPEDVSLQNLGYDIRSLSKDGRYRYIEVKARAGDGAIALTPNEWLMAQRLKEEYWMYVIINAAKTPELYIINNPVERLRPDEEIDIVRYIVKDWKRVSKKIGRII